MEDFDYEKWQRAQMIAARNIYHRDPTETPEPAKKANDDKHVWVFHTLIAVVALGCLVYWGNGNHLAVEVPVVDTALMQRYQVEVDLVRKQRDDYKKQVEVVKKLLLASNTKIAQYEQHLKALAESVPPQPVILEAVRKEAATENGFKKLVARNFGADIAKRVRVVE